ncbi:DNA polymerase III subunit delta' [Alkalihalophilus marmarensis]|uniref:DNA polymerase III subunit delta' n=1 Tax=Alkalihalophilus marmarensis TaxID=521377 RepID=UPI002DB73F08|nr:DNA polymerase III subunit delta' [Alkalihalophilus marmarensis]MEC2074221.1 DNA polymerase III subunit delta' [Alkalihalophilus marmarensis]
MSIQLNQPVAVQTLLNSLQRGTLSHAYLLQGANLEEQMRVVLFFLKKLLCGKEACEGCKVCKQISNMHHPDLICVKTDAATLKIEQVRELQKALSYCNVESDFKMVVIEKADTLTIQAQNALLKSIEEPEQQTIFFLLSSSSNNMLPTVRSRCQLLTLKPVGRSGEENVRLTQGEYSLATAYLYEHYYKGLEAASHEYIHNTVQHLIVLIEGMLSSQVEGLIHVSKAQGLWPSKSEQIAALSTMQALLQEVMYQVLGLQSLCRLYKDYPSIETIARENELPVIKKAMIGVEEAQRMMRSNTNGQMALEYAVLRLQDA